MNRAMNRSFTSMIFATSVLALLLAPSAVAQFSIDATTIPDAVVGLPYPAVPLPTTGGFGPITWSIVGSPVPPAGFAVGPTDFSGTTGAFCWGAPAGNPICAGNVQAIPGTYLFTVHAQDARLQIAERQFFVRIQQQLTISTTDLPDVQVNAAYSQQLQAVSGTGSYSWSVINGSLPPGISLDGSTGRIAGTAASVAGVYGFTIRLVDNNTGFTASRNYTINVLSGLQITSDSVLPLATMNLQMTPFQFLAVGGTTYQWAVASGSLLPTGLTLSTDGILSGLPTTAGVYHFTIRVTDTVASASAQKQFTLSVTLGALRINETQLAPAELNTPYQATLTGAGGFPPYTFSFATLDTHGLTINPSTGTITGSITSSFSGSLNVNLDDSTSTRVTKAFNLQVFPQLTLDTATLPNGAAGVPYSRPLSASGGQVPYHWLVTAGTVPPGLSVNADTGNLEGTPTTLGTSLFTARVTDNAGYTATRQVTVVVGTGVLITTTSLSDGIVGRAYSQALTASGGALPLSWSVVGGSLPAGLTIDPGTGAISGTPTVAGSAQVTIRVTDAVSNTNDHSFTLNISGALVITTGTLPGGTRNTVYSRTLTTSGGRAPFTWTVSSGTFPPGLILDSSTGAINGTPTTVGTFNFGVTVSDAGAQTTTASFTVTIADSILITTSDLIGFYGQALSQTLSAQGGSAPYTWSIISGALPSGLTLNVSTGQITGSPVGLGAAFTVQATDSMQQVATKSIVPNLSFPTPILTIVVPDSLQPGQQPQISISIPEPYFGTLQAGVSLSFTSAVGGDDDTVRFASGTRAIGFKIPEGSTQAVFTDNPVIITGTTAGTIVLSLFSAAVSKDGFMKPGSILILPLPNPFAKATTIARSAPVISSVTLERSTNSANVIVTGYSTTHEISSGTFSFAAAAGSTLAQTDIPVQLGTAFTTWFQSSASTATGGQFRLSVPFTIQGAATAISSVRVTLTNAQGISGSMTGQ